MHGQFLKDKEGVDWDRSWHWIAKVDMKGCTEALICSAQEQALRTNYIHWQLCIKGGFEKADRWYNQQPETSRIDVS